mmetsp:Transcript_71166/g.184778  ORF Transcript_71166/g.184778 Transcript_71166/m.184778 type:complete len:259 (-) Transcript_71166:465-1241(-)
MEHCTRVISDVVHAHNEISRMQDLLLRTIVAALTVPSLYCASSLHILDAQVPCTSHAVVRAGCRAGGDAELTALGDSQCEPKDEDINFVLAFIGVAWLLRHCRQSRRARATARDRQAGHHLRLTGRSRGDLQTEAEPQCIRQAKGCYCAGLLLVLATEANCRYFSLRRTCRSGLRGNRHHDRWWSGDCGGEWKGWQLPRKLDRGHAKSAEDRGGCRCGGSIWRCGGVEAREPCCCRAGRLQLPGAQRHRRRCGRGQRR